MTFAFVPADQFIQTKVTKWKNWDFKDKDLWEQFQNDFAEWTKRTFNSATVDVLRALRTYLRKHGVWISTHETMTKSLFYVLQKETETPWIEEEIKRCILTEHFTSNRIERLLETEFGRKPKNYSWQAAKRRSWRKESSSRESSVQQKSLSRFSKFFQSSEFPSVFFNRHLYSRLPPIPLYRKPPPIPPHLPPQNQLEEQPDGQSGEQPDKQSLRQSTFLPSSSENQSISRQSTLIIENSEHPSYHR